MPRKKRRDLTKMKTIVGVGIGAVVLVVGLVVGVLLSANREMSFLPPEAYLPSNNGSQYAPNTEPHVKSMSNLQTATAFRKWIDWYPVDFNQPEGYRVVNKWSSTEKKNGYFHGHSILNVPNNVSTLPATYKSNNVDYFFLFQCSDPSTNEDPNCTSYSKYLEIISQGSAVDSVGKTTLEHWARGDAKQYEVYYDPAQIGYDNCSGKVVRRLGLDLNDARLKKPWVLRLPQEVNQYYVSEPVCALVFKGYEQKASALIDTRSVSSGQNPSFETGNWISITITHDVFQAEGHEILLAENIYLTDNKNAADRFAKTYCSGVQTADNLRCQKNSNGQATSYTHTVNGREYHAFAFEMYYMRKTQSSGRYDHVKTGIIDKYGFGSFRWWTVRPPARGAQWENQWDIVNNAGVANGNSAENQTYDLERCELNQWHGIVRCDPV